MIDRVSQRYSILRDYTERMSDPNRFSMEEVQRKIEDSFTSSLFSAFDPSSQSSIGSFINQFYSGMSSESQQFGSLTVPLSTSAMADIPTPATMATPTPYLSGSVFVDLQYGTVEIKPYDQDYDINQSGQIGNYDNWGDDIDISAGQHDYDFNNDGRADGRRTDIDSLVQSIQANRYLQKSEAAIAGKLGLRGSSNLKIELYFSDRIMPNSSADGITGLTVSTDSPKIMIDLDEVFTKKRGFDLKVLTHEMTHALMYDKLKNDNQSAWFMEGAAVYSAGQGQEKISAAFRSGGLKLRGLDSLNQSVGDISGYAESYLAFEYIDQFYGSAKVKEFINNTLILENVAKGIEKTFNISSNLFNQRTRDYAKAWLNHNKMDLYA